MTFQVLLKMKIVGREAGAVLEEYFESRVKIGKIARLHSTVLVESL